VPQHPQARSILHDLAPVVDHDALEGLADLPGKLLDRGRPDRRTRVGARLPGEPAKRAQRRGRDDQRVRGHAGLDTTTAAMATQTGLSVSIAVFGPIG